MHEWLKEIYNDFCEKHDMPINKDGAYQSTDDILCLSVGSYPLSINQRKWLENYSRLWVETNGMEDWN